MDEPMNPRSGVLQHQLMHKQFTALMNIQYATPEMNYPNFVSDMPYHKHQHQKFKMVLALQSTPLDSCSCNQPHLIQRKWVKHQQIIISSA